MMNATVTPILCDRVECLMIVNEATQEFIHYENEIVSNVPMMMGEK